MVSAVVYAGRYGSTERHARRIADAIGAEVIEVDKARPADLSAFERVVFCSAIYSGRLLGIEVLNEAIDLDAGDTGWLLATVGISDPALADCREKEVAEALGDRSSRVDLVHLMGGLDFDLMNDFDRSAMQKTYWSLADKADATPHEKHMARVTAGTIDLSTTADVEKVLERLG